MPEKTLVPAITELASLAERAKRASERTSQLVEEYRFIVASYGVRPRHGLRTLPIFDTDRAKEGADMAPPSESGG